MAVEYACERCGGTAVAREAWAEWDVQAQQWLLATLFDFAFCLTCHKSTHLIARPASQGP